MTVYADILFAVNFSMDILTLWAVCAVTGRRSEVPVTFPSVREAAAGSVTAMKTTGMSFSSAALKHAIAEGVAMPTISAAFFDAKV